MEFIKKHNQQQVAEREEVNMGTADFLFFTSINIYLLKN